MTLIVTAHYRYRPLMVSGLFMTVGLAIAEPALSADNSFDGLYMGKRVLTKGSNQACPTEEDVSVTIRGEVLTFTSSRLHDFPMGFYAHPDGSFSETSTGIGGDFIIIQGRIAGGVLDADVTDSDCEHHWHLKRTRSP